MDLTQLAKPDSERLSELLPDVADETGGRKLFIGQDLAMLAMLRVHITCYSRRARNVQMAPEEVIHPLQEALFTGDGGMFSHVYLAMVERFVAKVNQQLGRDSKAERDLTLMAAIAPILYPGETPREPLEMMRGCLDELRRARTVRLYLCWDSKAKNPQDNVRQQVLQGVRSRFQINLWKHESLKSVVEAIPEPVFIDLYGSLSHSGRDTNCQQFYAIVEVVRTQMASIPEVYYLFRGRLPFLEDFGLPTPQGRFARIHLNPLTEMEIWELIGKTRRDGEAMSKYLAEKHDKYERKSLDEIVAALHHKSDGHAFIVHEDLRGGTGALGDERHINWLRHEIQRFPEAMQKYVFARRNDTDIDLEEVVDLGNGTLGTVGYLATRVHAGLGPYSRSSSIRIPASVLKYMESRFLLLSEYCMLAVTRRSNRETLVEMVMRCLQALFKEERSWGEAMGELCPRSFFLWHMRLQLDPRWRVDLKTYRDPYALGRRLVEPLYHGGGMIYRWSEESNDEDFFLVDKERKMVAAVKVVSEAFSQTVVETEARRFADIREGFVNARESLNATPMLIVYVFGPGLEDTDSRVYKTPEVEILTVNLSRPDLRRKFFEPAIPDNVDGSMSLIEQLVSRV